MVNKFFRFYFQKEYVLVFFRNQKLFENNLKLKKDELIIKLNVANV